MGRRVLCLLVEDFLPAVIEHGDAKVETEVEAVAYVVAEVEDYVGLGSVRIVHGGLVKGAGYVVPGFVGTQTLAGADIGRGALGAVFTDLVGVVCGCEVAAEVVVGHAVGPRCKAAEE